VYCSAVSPGGLSRSSRWDRTASSTRLTRYRLDALAGRLRAAHGTATEVIELDLAGEGALAELARRTGHLDIGLVVTSAGVVTSGPFLRDALAAEEGLLRLNLMVPAQLSPVYGQVLARRGRGGPILVSSTVAFAPVPYTANYAAAKAYVASPRPGAGLRAQRASDFAGKYLTPRRVQTAMFGASSAAPSRTA
jgi:short-subunit dehydrogenase